MGVLNISGGFFKFTWLILSWLTKSIDVGEAAAAGDMEAMKQEILREMRKEINKAKLEIIDGNGTINDDQCR